MEEHRYHIIELILRVFLGVLFFAQGYDKVFKLKISNVIDAFHADMEHKNVPSFVLVLSAYYTSIVELIGGLLLILGVFKYYTLAFLGFDLVLAACAFSILQPMWDMQYVFPRLILLTLLFIVPKGWGIYSMDYLIKLFNN